METIQVAGGIGLVGKRLLDFGIYVIIGDNGY